MIWEKIKEKYPEKREMMTKDRERSFVNDCFDAYEQEGFSKTFWSPYSDAEDFIGMKYKVLNRTTEERNHLSLLPLWDIEFENGKLFTVYPEEIIPSEMKHAGCPDDILKGGD